MFARRVVFFVVLASTAAALITLLCSVLAPGGWTVTKLLLVACFAGIAPWLGVCVGNALPGFLIRVLACDPARAVLPVVGDIDTAAVSARTVLAMAVRNERLDDVLPPLQRLLDELDPAVFSLFILSDTQDPRWAAAEEAAIATFPHPVRYRRRTTHDGFKAGNVMDFLDHHAGVSISRSCWMPIPT